MSKQYQNEIIHSYNQSPQLTQSPRSSSKLYPKSVLIKRKNQARAGADYKKANEQLPISSSPWSRSPQSLQHSRLNKTTLIRTSQSILPTRSNRSSMSKVMSLFPSKSPSHNRKSASFVSSQSIADSKLILIKSQQPLQIYNEESNKYAPILQESTVHEPIMTQQSNWVDNEKTSSRFYQNQQQERNQTPILSQSNQVYKQSIQSQGNRNNNLPKPYIDIQYPRGQKFFRKLQQYNKRQHQYSSQIDKNQYNSHTINSPSSQSRPQTAQHYKRWSASRQAIWKKQSEVKRRLNMTTTTTTVFNKSQTFSPKKSQNIISSLNSPKPSMETPSIPRSQLWFNPPQMTVQKLQKHYNTNSFSNKYKEYASKKRTAIQIEKDTSSQPFAQMNKTSDYYQHQSMPKSKPRLNLKSILNNMRQQRLTKLKKQMRYQIEKQDQNVINRFELSPTHEMKIWLPYHVKYINWDQNWLDRVKPGSKLVNQTRYQDTKPNMLQYTLESYIRRLYSPDDIPDNVGKFQSSGSKKLLWEMASLDESTIQNQKSQRRDKPTKQKEACQNQQLTQNLLSPSSRKQGQYVLVNSPQSEWNIEFQKRVIKDLRQKYIRAFSKRSIDQSMSVQQNSISQINRLQQRPSKHQSPENTINSPQLKTTLNEDRNLFQEGRKRLENLAQDHIAHRKQVKKKLKEEWIETKNELKLQMPPQFSLQMIQKQSEQKKWNSVNKVVAAVASRKSKVTSAKRGSIQSYQNSQNKNNKSVNKSQRNNIESKKIGDLNQTTTQRGAREFLGYNLSKTYGEKLLKLNLIQPNYHDKLKLQFN